MNIQMAKKWPEMVVTRSFKKGHSFRITLYLGNLVGGVGPADMIDIEQLVMLKRKKRDVTKLASHFCHWFFLDSVNWLKKLIHICNSNLCYSTCKNVF